MLIMTNPRPNRVTPNTISSTDLIVWEEVISSILPSKKEVSAIRKCDLLQYMAKIETYFAIYEVAEQGRPFYKLPVCALDAAHVPLVRLLYSYYYYNQSIHVETWCN